MPIYAYKCESCGHAKDILRKISDPPLTECPQCGSASFKKQVTAAGFQLKGSGWYVTDFRGGANTGAPAQPGESGAASSETAAAPAADSKTAAEPAASAKPAVSEKSAATPAPATSATPAAPGKAS